MKMLVMLLLLTSYTLGADEQPLVRVSYRQLAAARTVDLISDYGNALSGQLQVRESSSGGITGGVRMQGTWEEGLSLDIGTIYYRGILRMTADPKRVVMPGELHHLPYSLRISRGVPGGSAQFMKTHQSLRLVWDPRRTALGTLVNFTYEPVTWGAGVICSRAPDDRNKWMYRSLCEGATLLHLSSWIGYTKKDFSLLAAAGSAVSAEQPPGGWVMGSMESSGPWWNIQGGGFHIIGEHRVFGSDGAFVSRDLHLEGEARLLMQLPAELLVTLEYSRDHPPLWPEEPYLPAQFDWSIDGRYHRGGIMIGAGAAGIQTWSGREISGFCRFRVSPAPLGGSVFVSVGSDGSVDGELQIICRNEQAEITADLAWDGEISWELSGGIYTHWGSIGVFWSSRGLQLRGEVTLEIYSSGRISSSR